MNQNGVEVNKNAKRKRPISSNLSRASLVNKRFIQQQKDKFLFKISRKNDLCREPGRKANSVCSTMHKPLRVVYVFFVLFFFCRILHRQIVLMLRMIKVVNLEWARWVHLSDSGSQRDHRFRFILPTRAASNMID